MDADFAVELGEGDAVLDLPWSADGGPSYLDLKRHPELLPGLQECVWYPELADFLRGVNSSASAFESAKCDAWCTSEMLPEDEAFGAALKFGSYVDLLFSSEDARFSFPQHEEFARSLSSLLKRAPEMPCAAEFLIRRCYFQQSTQVQTGYYVTFYLFGYGDEEEQARQRWAIGLKLVENALRQLSAAYRS